MSEHDLVVKLMQGDEEALEAVYRLYAHSALRTAFLITRDRALAEDAVQDAFIQVYRNIGSLRSADTLSPWLYRIIVNSAKRQARLATRQRATILSYILRRTNNTPGIADDSLDDEIALRTAINELSDIYRIPLILRYFVGLSEVETAQSLELNQGTVKSRLHTARKILGQKLAVDRSRVKGE